MKRKAIIVDLDGTLCNTTHRQHYMEQKPKDWMAFYGGIPEDKPHEWCNEILSWVPFDVTVIFVSGRPGEYRKKTLGWLKQYSRAGDFLLLMRESGDFRKDSIVKTEIYRNEIEPQFDVLFCIDDRQQVVDAWRELGLTCLQCAKGDF